MEKPKKTDNDIDENQSEDDSSVKEKEYGGVNGPEPTRYGDWERNGRCTDF